MAHADKFKVLCQVEQFSVSLVVNECDLVTVFTIGIKKCVAQRLLTLPRIKTYCYKQQVMGKESIQLY